MYLSIIALPLFASIITGLFNRSITKEFSGIITSLAMVISFLISSYAFYKVGITGEIINIKICNWLEVGNFKADWTLYIDQLSAIMLIVITSVSAVVHIYSNEYMHDDPNLPRFMSYLSLFTVCMLLLVTSDNFLQLFFGWEGVGLCSYLLIGFWYKKDAANFAATKAFIVNRVGDFAFILGIITIYYSFGSVEFSKIFFHVQNYQESNIVIFGQALPLIEIIALLLFIGSMGKSAQLGLHVWLPDAMEGPTPVSALIHAATMVTAGVFLLARSSYIFEFAPQVSDFVVIIGAITCLFAALVALCQNDIKKIIAYSTCSQLGYMFIACGLSSYQAGIFHLYTHAFFKAMLFLAAGSVIHAVHEQDITKMGGLKKYMPVTYALFWLGSLAIMGIFPLSGYYSKDMIIVAAYLDESHVGNFAFRLGIIAAFCTAIYSTKIIIKVFHGESKIKKLDHDLEPSLLMNGPLAFLALGTVLAGFFAYKFLDIGTPKYGYFKDSIYFKEFEVGEHAPLFIELLPLAVAVAGMVVGYLIFATNLSESIARTFKPFYLIIKNKFYFDEIYEYVFVKPNDCLANFSKAFDKKVIDLAGPGLSSYLAYISAERVGYFHNGSVGRYAKLMILALVSILSILVYKFAI
jgi:NADH-quinone oxidoreductase subunit L